MPGKQRSEMGNKWVACLRWQLRGAFCWLEEWDERQRPVPVQKGQRGRPTAICRQQLRPDWDPYRQDTGPTHRDGPWAELTFIRVFFLCTSVGTQMSTLASSACLAQRIVRPQVKFVYVCSGEISWPTWPFWSFTDGKKFNIMKACQSWRSQKWWR